MATKSEELVKATQGKGCLAKAHPNEPIFILRAQDKLAATLVRTWADLARKHGCPDEKVIEAYDIAFKMAHWPNRKFPD